MAIAFVQVTAGGNGGPSSTTSPPGWSAATTSGNRLVFGATWMDTVNTSTTASITGVGGEVWTQIGTTQVFTCTNVGFGYVAFFECLSASGSTTPQTLNTVSTAQHICVAICEYSGTSPTAHSYNFTAATGNSAGPAVVGIAATASGDLLVAMGPNPDSLDQGAAQPSGAVNRGSAAWGGQYVEFTPGDTASHNVGSAIGSSEHWSEIAMAIPGPAAPQQSVYNPPRRPGRPGVPLPMQVGTGVLIAGPFVGPPIDWTPSPPVRANPRTPPLSGQQGEEIVTAFVPSSSLLNFGGWTADVFPRRAPTATASSADAFGDVAQVFPTPWVQWSDDARAGARTRSLATFQGDEITLHTAWAPTSWVKWSEDPPRAPQWPRPILAPNDVPYTGDSLGWAPSSWVKWTDDPARPNPRTPPLANQQGEEYLGALEGTGTLDEFGAWTQDAPARPNPRTKPIPWPGDVPYTGTSLGWAPTSWVKWSDDPLPWRFTKPLAGQQGEEIVTAVAVTAPTSWVKWVDEPLPGRPTKPLAGQQGEEIVTAIAPPAVTSWVAWHPDPRGPQTHAKPLLDAPFVGSSLGWAPSSWVRWVEDPAPRPRTASRAVGWDPLDDPMATFEAAPIVRWTDELPATRRPVAPVRGTDPLNATTGVSPTPFVRWVEEPAGRRPPRQLAQSTEALDRTQTGGFVPASLGRWTDDPIPWRWRSTPYPGTEAAIARAVQYAAVTIVLRGVMPFAGVLGVPTAPEPFSGVFDAVWPFLSSTRSTSPVELVTDSVMPMPPPTGGTSPP